MAAPATAAAPAHFLRLQAIDFVARGHGGLCIRILRQFRILVQRLRHQRSGLRGASKRRHTGRNTSGELEKFPAFHVSLLQSRVMQSDFHRFAMNAR